MNWIEYLQSVGPFTTPLCVALTLGLWWLERDRVRILNELSTALTDARNLRDRRVEDLVEGVKDYQELAAALREALDKLTDAVAGRK